MAALHPLADQTPSSSRRRAIQELVEGQQCAAELQIIVNHKRQHCQRGSSAEELVEKIMRSFDQTLGMLSAAGHEDDSKDRRGCRRRKRGAETWTIVSDRVQDGHAWRKYGQKNIFNSKYPRSYFRCTHKYDQGCRALKQVQRTEDEPQMYHITYIGTHTCRDSPSMAPQVTTGSESCEPHHTVPSDDSEVLLENRRSNQSNSSSPTLNHGPEEERTPRNVAELDSMTMWEDVIIGDGGFESEYGDVVSNMYPCNETSCLNLGPLELENCFQFDGCEFL